MAQSFFQRPRGTGFFKPILQFEEDEYPRRPQLISKPRGTSNLPLMLYTIKFLICGAIGLLCGVVAWLVQIGIMG